MLYPEPASVTAAIGQWRRWHADLPGKPEVVQPLGRGLSNQSFLLQAGEFNMVMRINNSKANLPGIDRQRETDIWHAASAAGIAPSLLYADDLYLVSAYVPGEQLHRNVLGQSSTNSALVNEDTTNKVFKLIDKCHSIDIDTQQLDYAQHIHAYWNELEQPHTNKPNKLIDTALRKRRQPMLDTLQILSEQQPEAVLCHHDPVMANFVGTPPRLYLIDWEYAAKGLAIMDYAALAVEWGFSDDDICTRTQIRPDSLVMAKKLYLYLCQLWQATQTEPQ